MLHCTVHPIHKVPQKRLSKDELCHCTAIQLQPCNSLLQRVEWWLWMVYREDSFISSNILEPHYTVQGLNGFVILHCDGRNCTAISVIVNSFVVLHCDGESHCSAVHLWWLWMVSRRITSLAAIYLVSITHTTLHCTTLHHTKLHCIGGLVVIVNG